MIRVILGIILLLSSVSAEHYALDHDLIPPTVTEIIVLASVGFILIFWGMPALERKFNEY